MNNFFRIIKPFFNECSKLGTKDTLSVVWEYYMYYFQKDYYYAHPKQVSEISLYPIPPFMFDIMIEAVLKYSSSISEKSLCSIETRKRVIGKLQPGLDFVYKDCSDLNPFNWLKSYIYNQAKMQIVEGYIEKACKYYYLYSTPSLSSVVSDKFKLDILTYVKTSLCLYQLFMESCVYKRDELIRYFKGMLNYQQFSLVLSNFCSNKLDYKFNKVDRIDVTLSCTLYANNAKFISKPFIMDGDEIMCPIPLYILNSMLDGLQYHLCLKDKQNMDCNKELAQNFENYIGELLSNSVSSKAFTFTKEIDYMDKSNKKTSDWLLQESDMVVFMDCKLKKLTVSSLKEIQICKTDINLALKSKYLSSRKSIKELHALVKNPLSIDIIDFGIDLGKIFCCYYDWKDNKIQSYPYSSNKKFCAIILTLEENYCNAFDIKDEIIRIAKQYVLEKKGEDIDINSNNAIIMSSLYFSDFVSSAAVDGLSTAINNEVSSSTSSSSMGTYLENDFFVKMKKEKFNL